MKRAMILLLVLALLLPPVALASSIGLDEVTAQNDITNFPDLGIFATLTASVPDEYGRVTVTLSEPVDRLWANWMGKGEKPEELFLDGNLKARFSTKGHSLQVGTVPPGNAGLFKQETSQRFTIQFGALDSQINWRTIQAKTAANGDNVAVVTPRWILYRVSDEVHFNEYSDDHNCTDIDVPEGFALQKVDGYAVSWRYGSNGSDGSPNLAYITLQKGYIVIYGRNGKIQYVTSYTPDIKVFGVDVGTGETDNDPSQTLHHYEIPESITEYTDLPELPPEHTFAQISPVTSGDGKSVTLFLNKPVDRIWVNWMGKGEEPEELKVDSGLKTKYFTDGHKYQAGTKWISKSGEQEKGTRQEIVWGAYPSFIEWAIYQIHLINGNNDPVKVVLPHWEVVEISTGRIVKEYPDDVLCTHIQVEEGQKLVKQPGYAVAYDLAGAGSDGSPNLAYITQQDGFTVIYNRAGKIVNVIKQIPQSHFFSELIGTATVRFQLSEFGKWYISDITEVYPNGRSITATYSRFGTGRLDNYQVSDF